MSEENKLPEVVDAQDTRTRKTVKLRTAASPIPRNIPIGDPAPGKATDTGNLEILEDTQTRKTLKLKPMMPGATAGPKLNLGGGEDTNTRKTVILRPSATTPPSITPAAAPAPATVKLDAAPAPAPAITPAVPTAKVDVDTAT